MEQAIAALAERQHGVVTLGQVIERGATSEAVRHRLRTGRWELVVAGVYRLQGTPRTWEQSVISAVLAAGPVAAASHRSAAALLGIPGFAREGPPEVTTPRPRRHRRPEAVVHRSRVLQERAIGRVDFAYREARLLIEVDSRRHHSSMLDADSDRHRDNSLTAAGWRVVRVTWSDVVERPTDVVGLLRRLLAAAAA